MATKTAMLTIRGITSTGTRPMGMAMMPIWMTTMTMICGEPRAGVFTHFPFLSAILISRFLRPTEIPTRLSVLVDS